MNIYDMISNTDQFKSYAIEIAGIVAAYRQELIKNGTGDRLADELTYQFANTHWITYFGVEQFEEE